MMQWRDENDETEDVGRMVKMGKSGNQKISTNEILFEEKRTNLKYKKINWAYTIHGWDYKIKSRKLLDQIFAILNLVSAYHLK